MTAQEKALSLSQEPHWLQNVAFCRLKYVSTFQETARSGCLSSSTPGLSLAAVTLPAQSCIAQGAGGKGGADFQGEASCGLFDIF